MAPGKTVHLVRPHDWWRRPGSSWIRTRDEIDDGLENTSPRMEHGVEPYQSHNMKTLGLLCAGTSSRASNG